MALKMHKVKHCHTDSVHFHNPTLCTQQFPLGVQKKIRANQLQRIGLHIKACLAAARSADYDNVEIMFMRVAVGAEAYILGQDVVFCRLLCVPIFWVKCVGAAPLGRAVLCAGVAVCLVEHIAVDGQRIKHQHRQQKFWSAGAPFQCHRIVENRA